MPDRRRCAYTHDVSDDNKFPDFDDDEWQCPHPVHGNAQKCVFHLDPNQTSVSDAEVARQFCWVINGTRQAASPLSDDAEAYYASADLSVVERKQFIGATFGSLRPQTRELFTVSELESHVTKTGLDLRDVTVEGSLDFGGLRIRHHLFAGGLTVRGSLIVTDATFEGNLQCSDAKVFGEFNLDRVTIEEDFISQNILVGGLLSIANAVVNGGIGLQGAQLANEDESILLADTDVETGIDLSGLTTKSGVGLIDLSVDGSVHCANARVNGDLDVSGTVIDGMLELDEIQIEQGGIQCDETRIEKSLEFTDGYVSDNAILDDSFVGLYADFTDTDIDGQLLMTDTDLSGASRCDNTSITEALALVGCTVEHLELCDVATPSISFEETHTTGHLQLREAKFELLDLDSSQLDSVTVDDCTIDTVHGYETTVSEGTIINSTVRDVDFDECSSDSLRFQDSRVLKDLSLEDAAVGRLKVEGTPVGERLILNHGTFEHIQLTPTLENPGNRVVELRHSTIGEGTLQEGSQQVVYDLAYATVGDVTIDISSQPVYNSVRLFRTNFDRFDFQAEESKLEAVGWKLYTLSDHARTAIAANAEFRIASTKAATIAELLATTPDVRTAISAGEYDITSLKEQFDRFPDNVPLTDQDVQQAIQTTVTELNDENPSAHQEESLPDRADNETTEDTSSTSEDTSEAVFGRTEIIARGIHHSLAETLATKRADPTDIHQSALDQATTQRLAKNDAQESGLEYIASEFFIWEMRSKRRYHSDRVRTPRSDDSWFRRAIAAYDWLGNALIDATTVYGERTNRAILSSLFIVGVFALIYAVLGAPTPTGQGLQDYLLFSFQSFIAFILGGAPATSNFWVQFASAIEGFMGAFFIALFVFALTRSIQR